MNEAQKDKKKMEALTSQRRVCKCGHTMFFYQTSYRDKIICTYCGRYIYKNDLVEFKEKLKKYQKDY